MSHSSVETVEIPLGIRLRLSHAHFQYLAEQQAIDLLHVKGYAFETDTYREGRQSSDIDVLVRPAHVDRLVALLLERGWEILTHFETGSIFEHAMTVYHPQWGLADIHRFFPGMGKDPAATFEKLWSQRRQKPVAAYPCTLPSMLDSQIIVLVHAGRSSSVNDPEVSYIRSRLSADAWQKLQDRVEELDAGIAFAAALRDLEGYKNTPEYLLWKSVSASTPDYVQWRARLRLASGFRAKARLLFKIFVVNRDHLAMELGHKPGALDIAKKFFSRFKFWGK